jgi:transcriptional regulator with XRE-family HTH domain
MINREELMRTNEYWFETLQNEIYRQVSDYLKKEGISQSQFAEKLGVSKGYISQIMNGNFNYTLKKLIELSLAVGKAPVLEFKPIESLAAEEPAQNKYNNDLEIQKVAEQEIRYNPAK